MPERCFPASQRSCATNAPSPSDAPRWAEGQRVQAIAPFLASRQQMDWYGLVMRAKGDAPGTNTHVVAGQVLLQHWTAKHPGGAA